MSHSAIRSSTAAGSQVDHIARMEYHSSGTVALTTMLSLTTGCVSRSYICVRPRSCVLVTSPSKMQQRRERNIRKA